MPYQNVDELPDKVKNNLEKSQWPKFLKAFNSAYAHAIKKYDDPKKADIEAMKVAWSIFNKNAEAMMANGGDGSTDNERMAEAVSAMGSVEFKDNHVAGQVWHQGPVSLSWGGVPTLVYTTAEKMIELGKYLIGEASEGNIELGVEGLDGEHIHSFSAGATIGEAKKFVYDENGAGIYMQDGEIFDTPDNQNLIEMNKRGRLKKRGFSMRGVMKLIEKDGKKWLDTWAVKRADIMGDPAIETKLTDPSTVAAMGLAEAQKAKQGGETEDKGTDNDTGPPPKETKEENIMDENEKLAEATKAIQAEADEKVKIAEAKAAKATEEITKMKEAEELRMAEAKKAAIKADIEKKVDVAIGEAKATPGVKENTVKMGIALAEANHADLFETHLSNLTADAWKKDEVGQEPKAKDKEIAEATKAYDKADPEAKAFAEGVGLTPAELQGINPKKDGGE